MTVLGRYPMNSPVTPGQKTIGRNAATVVAVEAMTGREGLRLAREARPDLILMDIQLPDIDGISALRELRADAAFERIAMIAISASVMPDEQQKIIASGFDAYITKPINLRKFIETVERHLVA